VRFQKGVSGNPAGRPSIAKILGAVGLTTSKASIELFEFAFRVIRDPKESMRNRIRMWEAISPHILGRPKENIEISGGLTPEQIALFEALKLTPHERRLAAQDSTVSEDEAAYMGALAAQEDGASNDARQDDIVIDAPIE
jgi:hypothetical protein